MAIIDLFELKVVLIVIGPQFVEGRGKKMLLAPLWNMS